MNKIYMIHCYDPATEREFIDMKGVYTAREVAEGVMGMMSLFQAKGDETEYSIRAMEVHEEADLDAWIAAKGPGAKRRAG